MPALLSTSSLDYGYECIPTAKILAKPMSAKIYTLDSHSFLLPVNDRT